jgi:hypothetical protein
MRRALIVAVMAAVFGVPVMFSRPVFASPPDAAALPDVVQTPANTDTAGIVPCPAADAPALAAGSVCCQRNGGLCGCRHGKPVCCDSRPGGDSCSCRGDGVQPEAVVIDAL